jgi:prepilin-type N-terminal cleavage/methylation domain-containing protein
MFITEQIVMAKKAFTLIEVLVVVMIIGILSAVGIFGFSKYTDLAKRKATEKNFFTVINVIEAEIAKCKLSGNRPTALTFNLPCPFQSSFYYQECAAIYMSWKYKIYNPLMPKEGSGWIAGSKCPTPVEETIRGGVRSGDGQQDGDVNIVICPRSPYCSADPATDGKMKVMWWYDGLKMQDSRIIQLIN